MGAEPTYLICVGATKSGTSWLYRHMRAHPECHFRSIKELHYFDMARPEHFADAGKRVEARITALEAEMQAGDPAGLAGKAEKLGDLWDWAEVLGRGAVDMSAYREYLVGGRKGQAVVGDVTPAYAMLPVQRLKRMAEVGQQFRVLFVMRDPLARVWSHIRMVAARTGEAFEATARALAGADAGRRSFRRGARDCPARRLPGHRAAAEGGLSLRGAAPGIHRTADDGRGAAAALGLSRHRSGAGGDRDRV